MSDMTDHGSGGAPVIYGVVIQELAGSSQLWDN
jgi:hypothetical protein